MWAGAKKEREKWKPARVKAVSQTDLSSFHFLSCYYSCLCNQIRIRGEEREKASPCQIERRPWGSMGPTVLSSILPNSLIFSRLSPHAASPQTKISCCWMFGSMISGVHVILQEACLTQVAFTNRYTSVCVCVEGETVGSRSLRRS